MRYLPKLTVLFAAVVMFGLMLPMVLLTGCTSHEQPLSPAERWSKFDELEGWTVSEDFDEAVKGEHLKRHPRHDSYIPISERKKLTESESEEYGRLNETLHEKLRFLSKEHFKNTPVPKELQKNQGDDSYFSPFTYQNYDWYGPSFECYILVLTDYVSTELLQKFQAQLHDEFQDWCIRVACADTSDFRSDHDLAVFSDRIIVPVKAARVTRVPKPDR
jgi:hypothetical protein